MSRPRLVALDRRLLPGLVAVALCATLAATVLTVGDTGPAEFVLTDPAGFGDASSVTGIGYALLGDPAAAGSAAVYEHTESFLVALVVLGAVLDAAASGALLLADRDGGESE